MRGRTASRPIGQRTLRFYCYGTGFPVGLFLYVALWLGREQSTFGYLSKMESSPPISRLVRVRYRHIGYAFASVSLANPPIIVSLEPFPAKWWLGDSSWLHRGWTFQEKALPPRCLIFTQQQIFWECQRSLWCEDRTEETSGGPILYAPTFTHGLFKNQPCQLLAEQGLKRQNTWRIENCYTGGSARGALDAYTTTGLEFLPLGFLPLVDRLTIRHALGSDQYIRVSIS